MSANENGVPHLEGAGHNFDAVVLGVDGLLVPDGVAALYDSATERYERRRLVVKETLNWAAETFAGNVALVSTSYPADHMRGWARRRLGPANPASQLWRGARSDYVVGADDLAAIAVGTTRDQRLHEAEGGLSKAPENAAIRLAIARLGLRPDRIAAVDSNPLRLAAARDLGFGAIVTALSGEAGFQMPHREQDGTWIAGALSLSAAQRIVDVLNVA